MPQHLRKLPLESRTDLIRLRRLHELPFSERLFIFGIVAVENIALFDCKLYSVPRADCLNPFLKST